MRTPRTLKTVGCVALCFLLAVGAIPCPAQFGDDFGTGGKSGRRRGVSGAVGGGSAEFPAIMTVLDADPNAVLTTPRSFIRSDDAELRQKLEKRTTISLDEDDTFGDLFKTLKEEHDIQAIVDPRGAGALGITVSSPIIREPFRLENVPLRRILPMILREQDLTYVIDEGFLQITSEDEAKKMMKVRVYPVADLVRNPDAGKPIQYITTELPKGGGWSGGPMPVYAEMIDGRKGTVTRVIRESESDFSELMDLIECVIAPDSWGEGAEMMEFYPGLCLAVLQTDVVHDEMEDLFAQLRAKRARPNEKSSDLKSTACRISPKRFTGRGGRTKR